MGNVWKIIKDDFKNLCSSAISLCVVFGLIAVPTIYSLFNIAGYWDPYSGTSKLEIGVVNSDAGYKTDVLPVDIQLGEYVMDSLYENQDFKWVVTDYDTAMDKVYSGEFYAALVIPSDFSKQLVDILVGKEANAKIEYYSNQKFSPITPKLIDNDMNTLQQKINISFSQTVYQAALKIAYQITNVLDPTTTSRLSSSLVNSFVNTRAELNNLDLQMQTLKEMLSTIDDVLNTSNELLTSGDSEKITRLNDILGEVYAKTSVSRQYIDNARAMIEPFDLPKIKSLLNDMSAFCTNIENIAISTLNAIKDAQTLDDNLVKALSNLKNYSGELKDQISFMQNDFASISNDLQLAIDKLSSLSSSTTLEDIKKIIGEDPSSFAEIISSPVVMDRHELYPVQNFGTAISGFFISLSC